MKFLSFLNLLLFVVSYCFVNKLIDAFCATFLQILSAFYEIKKKQQHRVQ